MKKVLLSALAVFAFTFANAQDSKGGSTDISFGAKAGLNLSNITGDVEGASMKIGFQVGGFAEIKISEKFAIQPELLYSAQGASFKEEFFGETFEYDINLSYLNIPVMAKYFVTDKLSLEAGPQIGFLLSAKAKSDSASEDIKDGFNSLDFGINFGAGFDVTENINLGLRYTAGLSNIAKDSGDMKAANSNIAFAVGYRF